MNFIAITWDPSLGIDLGFFTIRWYSLMFVAAFIMGLHLMKKSFTEEKISLEKLDTLFMYTFISMLVGMRLGEVFFYNWEYFQNNLIEILLPIKKDIDSLMLFGIIDGYKFVGYRGLASHGATIGIITAMFIYK